ncbi:hypothetical protein B0I35DRAFT_444999, partial [Stachybotrys elegans]
PMERGREAFSAGDGDSQDKAWNGPSLHTDKHGQSCINILKAGPMGGGREA